MKLMNQSELIRIARLCEQCGSCTATCPFGDVSEFNIRKLVRYVQLDLCEEREFLMSCPWLCSLCARCRLLCTEALEIPKLILALRAYASNIKVLPAGVHRIRYSIGKWQSPYRTLTRTKTDWLREVKHKSSTDGTILYWVGCTASIMIPIIAKSTVNLFAKLGIKFKLWHQGNGLEPCCGEPLIAFGLFADAKSIGTRIIDTVTHAKNVEALVTSCSGCYNTFINLYPKTIGIEFSGINIYHTSQLLADHISEISLKANKPLRIIYHDACSLGRHTNVYDAPRAVLDAIDGVERVELTMNREFSMCCGGGGGVWALNPKVAMKLATEKIISEALRLNADCIVTCCPLCALNFKRSIPKTRKPFPIYDLSEFVVRCI